MNYKKANIIIIIYYLIVFCVFYFTKSTTFYFTFFMIGMALHGLLKGYAKDNEIKAKKTKEYEQYLDQQKNSL